MKDSYVVVDLETTGLHPKQDRILEIGALKVVAGSVVGHFQMFVDPQMKIPGYITELTGITQRMVEGQPEQREAAAAFLEFCGDFCLMGHNVIFDYSFLKHQAVNMGCEFEKTAIDTLQIARCAFPGLPSRSLESMCSYYAIDRSQAHRAFDDAKATLALYDFLWSEFGENNPEWFRDKPLVYKVKRQTPLTPSQKRYLNDLIKYHKIGFETEIDSLTKSEASRAIDQIILAHGRIER